MSHVRIDYVVHKATGCSATDTIDYAADTLDGFPEARCQSQSLLLAPATEALLACLVHVPERVVAPVVEIVQPGPLGRDAGRGRRWGPLDSDSCLGREKAV